MTVLCFVSVLLGCGWLVCLLLCKEEGSSPVSWQLPRGGIWACMRCPCLCLCCVLGWGHNVGQFPYVGNYVVVKSFNHTREECESKRVYVF